MFTPDFQKRGQSMKSVILAAIAVLAASPALAQAYYDFAGTPIEGVMAIPYTKGPLSPGQHNLTLTSSSALTIPTGARYANVCASLADIRYTTDGTTTPTVGIGQPLAAGACIELSGPQTLQNFRAISASGTLDVEYFR
jgi:hypothetical protein